MAIAEIYNRFQTFGHADPEVAWSTVRSAILDVASEVIGYRRAYEIALGSRKILSGSSDRNVTPLFGEMLLDTVD